MTVDELIKELKEISDSGYGEATMFVPCECGYTGANIIEGYEICDDYTGKYVMLYSDDM